VTPPTHPAGSASSAGLPSPTLDFLVRAAREFRRGGWVFTGFHWPVLAGQLAHRLPGAEFTQAFEAGAITHEAGRLVPTSTTDYPAYGNALGYVADTASVLLAMARRFDRVVLDAGNVDVLGRVNSSLIGERVLPTVRLPGGGGAPDVAAAARELVWLHGGSDLRRIQARVEHVTAAPGPQTLVRLHTRWGVARLGADPALEEIADVEGAEEFIAHLAALGARTAGAATREPVRPQERAAAAAVLREAAARSYAVARRALAEPDPP
jgi:glutaconate CoA-transferase, subunit B